jgi:hypothetical protein
MLQIRKQYQIDLAQQIAVPAVKNAGAVIMLHKLPEMMGYEITALNFGSQPIAEQIDLRKILGGNGDFSGKNIIDLLTGQKVSVVSTEGIVNINLAALQGKVLLIK